MLYQDNYLVASVKLNFCQRQTHCIDDQDKFQSVTDTENKLTECQKSSSLHASTKTLKSNISQGDSLKDSESDSYNKNDTSKP